MTSPPNQTMAVIQGKTDVLSREFLQWLRDLVRQSNYALTFAAVKAALATADSSVGFNGQALDGIDTLTSSTGGIIDGFAGFRTNGSQSFALRDSGNGGGALFYFQGRSFFRSPSNGLVEFRNNEDNAYSRVKVGTPTEADDAVTKAYADALGGGASITQIEVDLGSTPVRSGRFTITDAGISGTSKIIVTQAGGPYTGKGTLGDEAEMDAINVAATPGSGSASAYWNSRTAVRGNVKFNYMVGA